MKTKLRASVEASIVGSFAMDAKRRKGSRPFPVLEGFFLFLATDTDRYLIGGG